MMEENVKVFSGDLKNLSRAYLYTEKYVGNILDYSVFTHNFRIRINKTLIKDIVAEAKYIKKQMNINPKFSRIAGATIGFADNIKFVLLWEEREILILEEEKF